MGFKDKMQDFKEMLVGDGSGPFPQNSSRESLCPLLGRTLVEQFQQQLWAILPRGLIEIKY